jgi:hypothetical protein
MHNLYMDSGVFELKRLAFLHKYTSWRLVGHVVNRQPCCLYSGHFGEELHSLLFNWEIQIGKENLAS